MDDKTFYTLIVTIILAVVGIVAKYWIDIKFAQRKDQLDRINQQLKYFYGPFYATDQAAKYAWLEFRKKYRPGGSYWRLEPPPTEEEKVAWRLWMTEVFMPLNLRLEKLVVENADLLIEEKIPESLLNLCAHVAAYKAVIKSWENGDYSKHTSLVNYPWKEARAYITDSFNTLKAEQTKLLGKQKIRKS